MKKTKKKETYLSKSLYIMFEKALEKIEKEGFDIDIKITINKNKEEQK